MRELDLSPLFRSTVGFDGLDKLFETALRETGRDTSYPPYNIVKTGENTSRSGPSSTASSSPTMSRSSTPRSTRVS